MMNFLLSDDNNKFQNIIFIKAYILTKLIIFKMSVSSKDLIDIKERLENLERTQKLSKTSVS